VKLKNGFVEVGFRIYLIDKLTSPIMFMRKFTENQIKDKEYIAFAKDIVRNGWFSNDYYEAVQKIIPAHRIDAVVWDKKDVQKS
jgi:hypothetical protein